MKLAHTILAGAALAVSMASVASAADLLITPDPIYETSLFDFEGLYVGGSVGGVAIGGAAATAGGVVGANFGITDGIIAGVEFQGDTYWNAGGYAGFNALGLARVGGFVSDNAMVYGDVGAGFVNGAAAYAFGGGVELAMTDSLSVRGDIQGLGAFGALPSGAKATAGVLFHLN